MKFHPGMKDRDEKKKRRIVYILHPGMKFQDEHAFLIFDIRVQVCFQVCVQVCSKYEYNET